MSNRGLAPYEGSDYPIGITSVSRRYNVGAKTAPRKPPRRAGGLRPPGGWSICAALTPAGMGGLTGETSLSVHRLKQTLLIPCRGLNRKGNGHGSSRVHHASAA